MKSSVGRNIARLRLSQGMTQEQLAQRMGVTPQAVSKWENDLNYPDVATLPTLAALLGTSVDALLTVAGGETRPPAGETRKASSAPATAPSPGAAAPAPSASSAADPAPAPLSSAPSAASPTAPASTGFTLVRPEPATRQGRQEPRTAGRSLHIEVRGPRDNVDLAFPIQAVSALAGLVATVPQVRTAVGGYGIDLDALVATSFSALGTTGPSTLIDVTDEEDHVRIYVD